nr:type II toxin-antitoxin system RelE/ParE family toxin [Steroidobacter denitrificans]
MPLAQPPKMGRAGRPGLPAFVRELVAHRNYILFYRVLDETRTVEILRVKHAAQQTPWQGGGNPRDETALVMDVPDVPHPSAQINLD